MNIYRFLIEKSIDDRIDEIQQKKIAFAQKVCADEAPASSLTSGITANAKLNLNDFKMLFQAF